MDENYVVSAKELAEIFRITERHIHRMVKERDMPKMGRGQFSLPDCIQWLIGYHSTKEEAKDLEEQRFLLCRAQTEKEELQNAVRRGELVEIQDVHHLMNEATAALAGQHDGLAPRLAGELIGQTDAAYIQEVINAELHQIRINLSATFATWASDPVDDGDYETAADPGRGGVGGTKQDHATA